MTAFVRFPRTPHLFWLGVDSPRGDKMLTLRDAEALLTRPACVEEKVDGACIGFSVDASGDLRVQSRGRYLTRGEKGQFYPLWRWLAPRAEALRHALGRRLILYGEWCYARHTVAYDALPDWFLAFDVFDRETSRFWSRDRRGALAARLGIARVPLVAADTFKRRRLETLLGRSRLGSEPMEGLYLRWDEGPWLSARAKLVRRGWIMADDRHWARRPLETNRLAETGAATIVTPSR